MRYRTEKGVRIHMNREFLYELLETASVSGFEEEIQRSMQEDLRMRSTRMKLPMW